jgi:hypothetical protein
MTPTPKRADPLPPAIEVAEPLELTGEDIVRDEGFDQGEWVEKSAEQRGAGGRAVLGFALAVLALLWLG